MLDYLIILLSGAFLRAKWRNVKEEWPDEWYQYRQQIVGVIILHIATLFAWGSAFYEPLVLASTGFLIIVGLFDLALSRQKLISISKWTQRQFKPKTDFVLLIVGLLITIACFWGRPVTAHQLVLFAVLGRIRGHLFWHGD